MSFDNRPRLAHEVLNDEQTESLTKVFERCAQLAIGRARWRQCCLNCGHFDEPTETCALAGSRPPARVIAEGCPKWEDEIPF